MGDGSEQLRSALRSIMADQKLSVSGWAKRAKIAEGTLRNFLAGTSATITVDTLIRLGNAVGVNPASLIGDAPLETAGVVPVTLRVGYGWSWDVEFTEPPIYLQLPEDVRYSPSVPRMGARIVDWSAGRRYPMNAIVVYISYKNLNARPRSGDFVLVEQIVPSRMHSVIGPATVRPRRRILVQKFVDTDDGNSVLESTDIGTVAIEEIDLIKPGYTEDGLVELRMWAQGLPAWIHGVIVASYALEFGDRHPLDDVETEPNDAS